MTDLYTLDGLIVDLSAINVLLHNQSVQVTLLEYRLLAYLARHAGRSVPMAELLREVWGCCPKDGGTEAQVENCVCRLRRKIEPDPDHPRYLLNVRGAGYLLTAPEDEQSPQNSQSYQD